ncbi:MAG TPA: sulfur carrier protein ThiS [Pseudonocardiaceae bacterium]|jgi:sulfur carrier protein|nr:sulfur carrier protein ThiS [Pseudonocardiaceae bacterium]
MTVVVNGACWELPEGATLADVLMRLDVPGRGVAVALDGAVVPRASWPATALADGAAVEVLTAVQGG